MDSLSVTFAGSISGTATGIPTNEAVTSPLTTSALSASLSSTGTGASKADQCFGPRSLTLVASDDEEHDLTAFMNTLGETGKSISKCRLFYLIHSTSSTASSISFGNASGTPWLPFGMDLSTPLVLTPGEGIILPAPTTAGMPVSAGARLIKILNNDGANSAIYEVFWSGET